MIWPAETKTSRKGEREAQDFLRWLYREGRLTAGELSERLGALERLAAGELRPARLGDGRVREKDTPKPGGCKEISGWPGKLERKIEPGHSAEGPRDPGLSCPPPQ